MSERPITRELIKYARGVSFDSLPPKVLLTARTCVLDWLGCCLAGSREPLTELLAAEAATHGPAGLIGRNQTTSIHWAALVNGAAAHALDFDDTHLVMMGHPSAPVLPALIAIAEERGAAGHDLLAAHVAGVETECRLAALLGGGHYAAGWHATATLGTFGAAAACAHFLGHTEDVWAYTLGIAGVQAGGLKSVFGTMSKPFQVGRAAQNGLLAATLAGRGLTSADNIIETAQGFAATHASTFSPQALDDIGERFLVRETVFKYHASCYLTHSAMEAALALADRHKIDPDAIERVEVAVPAGHLSVCNIAEPRTGLEGKFSLRATTAMALLGDDTADPLAFTDERMSATELVRVRDKVEVQASDDVRGTESAVRIAFRNGETLVETTDVGRPADDLDRQWERLTVKFIRLASPIVGEDTAWRLRDLIGRLEDVANISDITVLCRPGP